MIEGRISVDMVRLELKFNGWIKVYTDAEEFKKRVREANGIACDVPGFSSDSEVDRLRLRSRLLRRREVQRSESDPFPFPEP
jgi:hypothetical protein